MLTYFGFIIVNNKESSLVIPKSFRTFHSDRVPGLKFRAYIFICCIVQPHHFYDGAVLWKRVMFRRKL